MNETLKRILPRVQKPARYVGGEYGMVHKEKHEVNFRAALCFPDIYEIGMSNLGLRILYAAANAMPGVWCERVFSPWADMEAEMRAAQIPLYGLESGDAISEFDLIGFSLGYEMAYTNVLNSLDLAGIPLRSTERNALTPLIIAGGTCTYNAEPLAPFIDLFCIGEGEEMNCELIELLRHARDAGLSKEEFLLSASKIQGIYVPSLYDVSYHADGTIAAIHAKPGAPSEIKKRVVMDMDRACFPAETIIPSTEITHDRVMLELFRGCIRGCRFCQAGFIYRPVRGRSPELLQAQAEAALRHSGYQEMTLSSLSSSDYPQLLPLCDGLLDFCAQRQTSISLPSLRADNFSVSLMERLAQGGRKSGLTFAPEAGSQRLRDAINKNLTEEELLSACRTAFAGGWNAVKLYFMLSLPTETDEDVLGIAALAEAVYRLWREVSPNRARGVRITVSTSCFVPKAHTPFQWEAQNSREEYLRKVTLLRGAIRNRSITYNWHDPETSFLEAVLSRGDRRLADVIEHAFRNGAKFDAWSEYFDLDRWLDAFAAFDLDPAFYANRQREREEVLPWSMIATGVSEAFFWQEREACYADSVTPDCRSQCSGCGALEFCPEGGICYA